MSAAAGPEVRHPGEFLAGTVALLALALAGVVVLVLADRTWALVLAVVAAGAGSVGAAISVGALLADQDGSGGPAPLARAVTGLGTFGVAALVASVVVAIGHAKPPTPAPTADAAAAAQSVRDFLTAAVVDDDAFTACGYLTPAEGRRVARLAGDGQTCRAALTANPPALGHVATASGLRALDVRSAVSGGRARVTVTGAGAPLAFTLRPATPAERDAFEAPLAAWRIASGATALLRRGSAAQR
jgi:hypothetical protein